MGVVIAMDNGVDIFGVFDLVRVSSQSLRIGGLLAFNNIVKARLIGCNM